MYHKLDNQIWFYTALPTTSGQVFESPHQLHNKTLLADANRVFDIYIYILNIKYYMWRKGMNEYSDDLLFA